MKQCLCCEKIKSLDDFKDNTLASGFGRHCKVCKNKRFFASLTLKGASQQPPSNIKCLVCNAPMILRESRRDKNKFYGCSRFPKCWGTKPYK
jgi:hypothetical protein